MKAAGWGFSVILAGLFATSAGCYVPKSQVVNCETTNRVLAEQNRATRRNRESQGPLPSDRGSTDPRRAGTYCPRGRSQFRRAGRLPGGRLPAAVSQRLQGWAQQYPNLTFDAETGVSKCDLDVLFDSGQAELKPAARNMLVELAQVLQLAEAKDLKIMVVGHTDSQPIVGAEARDKYANNFHLSTARALAVADLLRSQGLRDQRIGVAGFGTPSRDDMPALPVVANDSATQRQRNRRVEIFVMPRDVPVVGWSESTSGSYY